MVVFTCNACGNSVKKNKVEKHYQFECKRCDVLSCMDCGKDFRGDEYKSHVKCITEDEKYGGKDFVPKPSANKGEVKQEQWIELLKRTVQEANVTFPALKDLMEMLLEYPNLPRKKPKFVNFIRNSIRIKNPKLIDDAWDICFKAQQAEQAQTEALKNAKQETQKEKNDENETKTKENGDQKIKKEKKKKDKNKIIEEPESLPQSDEAVSNEGKKHKKHKKRKASESETNDSMKNGVELNNDTAKKQKLDEIDTSIAQDGVEEQVKTKFRWEKMIKAVLQEAPEQELSIKKLRKKLFAAYAAHITEEGRRLSIEELHVKFDKKVNKNPKFKVKKERVKLVTCN